MIFTGQLVPGDEVAYSSGFHQESNSPLRLGELKECHSGAKPGGWWVLGERKNSAVSAADNIGAVTTPRPGGGGSAHLNLEEESCGERPSLEELGPFSGTGFPALALVTWGLGHSLWRGCSVHCRMFHSISGLLPPGASSIPTP